MKAIDLLPEDPVKRLEELILDSWRIFVSEFVHGKYEIVKEASFQLHFAGVMKQLAVHYELANDERIKIELEKPIEYQFKGRKGAIDIVLEYSRVGMAEMIWIPIELKFRKKGDAADLTVAEIYEDIISLEQVKEESNAENQIPYAFFSASAP